MNCRRAKMKVAQKVILLLDGVAAAISGGLHPAPTSNFQMLNDSFELPLDCYGINDRKASGDIVHFVDSSGCYEVSIFILQSIEPPILACALNEVMLNLAGDGLSTMPTLIVPFVVPESKLKQESKYHGKSDKVSVYGIKLGQSTDVTESLGSRLQKPPSFLHIHHEELAVLLHLINVMKLPTILLIGLSTDRRISNKSSSNEDVEVICQIGEYLASVSSLSFAKEKMIQNPTTTSRDSGEAWRSLYG